MFAGSDVFLAACSSMIPSPPNRRLADLCFGDGGGLPVALPTAAPESRVAAASALGLPPKNRWTACTLGDGGGGGGVLVFCGSLGEAPPGCGDCNPGFSRGLPLRIS